MDIPARGWKNFFSNWPAGVARRGVLVVAFGEQIPFAEFWMSETFLLIQRKTPDTLGARMLVLPYEQIAALKVVDVVKPKVFRSAGFEGPPSVS